jgi:hypothetical protein
MAGRVVRGIGRALRRHPAVFAGVAVGVAALSILGPPAVLSLARQRVDYFTTNPWLRNLPAYLADERVPLEQKLEKVPALALFWFSADSPFGGVDWGFAVDVTDLARIAATAALFGTYFALWVLLRRRAGPALVPAPRSGGMAGVLTSVVGLSTGPCSVMGCGAPVIPVVGLAFAGLSSGTLALLASLSRVTTWLVLAGLLIGIAWLGWRAGAPVPATTAAPAPVPAPADAT